MNKRISTVLVGVAVLSLSSSAFASRAREVVMGTGDPFGVLGGNVGGTLTNVGHGTFFYDDNYNVFYNPSYANDFKNWATIEKDNGTNTGSQAEGGFVTSLMNFSIGAFMNRGGATSGTYSILPTTADTLNPIDVIVAGDMGVKWGVGATFGHFKVADNNTATELTLRAGVQFMDLEPFAAFQVKGDDKNAGTTTDNDDFTAGLKYHWGEWTPYAAYRKVSTGNIALSAYGLGIGRSAKVSDKTTMHYTVGYWKKTGPTGTASSVDQIILPIDFSVESEFTGWLIGRAGLTYNLLNQNRGNSVSGANTTGRLGATLRFNKVDVDFAVAGNTSGTGYDTPTFSFADGLFSVASLTYRW